MNINDKNILRLIVEQITDFKTWQNFSLVSKDIMNICKSLWDKRKYKLAIKNSRTLPSGNNYPFDKIIIYMLPYIKVIGKGGYGWSIMIETIKGDTKTVEHFREPKKLKYKTVLENEIMTMKTKVLSNGNGIYYTEYYYTNGNVRYCGYDYGKADSKFGEWNSYNKEGIPVTTDIYIYDDGLYLSTLNKTQYHIYN